VRPAGIILAGGASSRFGADKLAATLPDGRPVLAHAAGALATVAGPLVLVLAPGADAPDLGIETLIAHDAAPHGGPLVGLATGLAALQAVAPGAAVAIVVAGDMPTLAPAVLELLADALDADTHPAADAATLEADPPSVFPLALRVGPANAAAGGILAGGGKRSMRALLEALPSAVIAAAAWRALDPAAATLHDIDTPADLEG
jgi:molybdenum cofactor guanylyltransferase